MHRAIRLRLGGTGVPAVAPASADRAGPAGDATPGAWSASPLRPAPDDDDAAQSARARFAAHGPDRVTPDAVVGPHLRGDEGLTAGPQHVVLHAAPLSETTRRVPQEASAYVTTSRLLVIGETTTAIGLDEVRDAVILEGSLVLILDGGHAVGLETERPRLLRTQIAAVRAVRQAPVRSRSGTAGRPPGGW